MGKMLNSARSMSLSFLQRTTMQNLNHFLNFISLISTTEGYLSLAFTMFFTAS